MSETPEKPTSGEDNASPFKISIQVTESLEGDMGLQVVGQAVKLVECRKLLTWALSRVNDEIAVEMTKNLIEERLNAPVKTNGFRKTSLMSLFKR